jgi:AraC family transcriptional regulator of adaptative response/methylated-DNA-[protein]-cysteine methyltransferase
MTDTDYQKIEKAIHFIENNHNRQPSLEEISRQISLSPFHTQRLFKRWAGISPKRFTQFLTINHAKTVLKNSGTVLDAAYDSGLSSSGRLHDLFVTFDAVTPGEFRKKGESILIRYGHYPCPFGACFLGVTERGICWLSFYGEEGPGRSKEELFRLWEEARFKEDNETASKYIKKIFSVSVSRGQKKFSLFIKGTNFQIKVWEALLKIPEGRLLSYEALAGMIHKSKATRALASALARNPVSYLIPCHRVLKKSGQTAGYRWGTQRKKAIIAWEASRSENHFHP